MNTVFADAGYWIALFNPRDQLHDKAVVAAQVTQGRLIVTSQMVLTEFLNHYASFGEPFRRQAVEMVRSLQDDADVEVILQTDDQFVAALTFFPSRVSSFTAWLKGPVSLPKPHGRTLQWSGRPTAHAFCAVRHLFSCEPPLTAGVRLPLCGPEKHRVGCV
jgi:uncharacterized protein